MRMLNARVRIFEVCVRIQLGYACIPYVCTCILIFKPLFLYFALFGLFISLLLVRVFDLLIYHEHVLMYECYDAVK